MIDPGGLPEHARILIAIRRRRGWTQRQLAFELCVSRRTIQNWELGVTSPNTRDMPVLRAMLMASFGEAA